MLIESVRRPQELTGEAVKIRLRIVYSESVALGDEEWMGMKGLTLATRSHVVHAKMKNGHPLVGAQMLLQIEEIISEAYEGLGPLNHRCQHRAVEYEKIVQHLCEQEDVFRPYYMAPVAEIRKEVLLEALRREGLHFREVVGLLSALDEGIHRGASTLARLQAEDKGGEKEQGVVEPVVIEIRSDSGASVGNDGGLMEEDKVERVEETQVQVEGTQEPEIRGGLAEMEEF